MVLHQNKKNSIKTILFGGVLPVLGFTLVEAVWGVAWGLVIGMAFGIGEMAFEFFTRGKVSWVTWAGNAMLIGLGGISLLTQEGVWFKMQPALFEAGAGFALVGSCAFRRPLLIVLGEKQGAFAQVPAPMVLPLRGAFSSLTLRCGIFFLVQALIASHAALNWSTNAWALLKGVGFTGSLVVYLALEMVLLRKKLGRIAKGIK